jgi:hypothetical protein
MPCRFNVRQPKEFRALPDFTASGAFIEISSAALALEQITYFAN